ncbi:MAG: MBL fold metallo-hydrolase [Candidatus Micrarchaeaceae archaeon]
MEISFLGGAGEVGRSCIMVKTKRSKILLDAGIKLGTVEERPKISAEEIRELSGVFITHAHLDHCGFLPHLYSAGYNKEVYATKPTIELLNVIIGDYLRISKPSGVTKEGLGVMSKHQKIVDYDKEFRFDDLTIKFVSAGHILGSALISVSDGNNTLLYTGDINLANSKLLAGANLKGLKADTLIMESTYGAKSDVFPKRDEVVSKMVNSIKETIIAGGKVIIPTFAVGRGQEVLLLLDDYINSGRIPKVQVYIDGMINRAMRIHRHNVIFCREELQKKILMSDYDPFKSPNFVQVERRGERNRIASSDSSSIIVTTSGMLVGGPALFYLSKLAKDPLNKIILVGYQAEGTLGRALQDGANEIVINHAKIKVELKVEKYKMSAHADRQQLELLPKKIEGIRNIFIVHGEKSKSEDLKTAFERKYFATVPEIGQKFTI